MDPTRAPRLTDRLPILGAGAAGLLVAALAALAPDDLLEGAVGLTGVDALVPVAAPPLGATARAVIALGGGMVAAAVAWAVLFLLVGPGGLFARPAASAKRAPAMRRADAHPDAPPRRPVSAADLGPPPPPVVEVAPPPPEQDLPRDLDQPLAAFDAAAIPDVPRAPTPALPPLAPSLAPPPALEKGERIETFDLSPREPGSTAPSIADLLDRLERGTARRAAG